MGHLFFGVDAALNELTAELLEDQRIWLIERSDSGFWGVAVIRDLLESEWVKPEDGSEVAHSDTYKAIAYRRDTDLAKAIRDVAEQLRALNQERADTEAEEKFLQPINPDPVTGIAKELKQ
jgi:hypothetical protein